MTTYRNTSEAWGDAVGGLTVEDYQRQARIFADEQPDEGLTEITSDARHIYADGVPVADAEEATTTHTPGPWEIRPTSRAGNGTGWRDIVSTGAAVGPTYVGEALEQDAALIAACPDMLAALRRIADGVEGGQSLSGTDCREIARAAIAKAEGR